MLLMPAGLDETLHKHFNFSLCHHIPIPDNKKWTVYMQVSYLHCFNCMIYSAYVKILLETKMLTYSQVPLSSFTTCPDVRRLVMNVVLCFV